ncbi:hypothetical protein ARMA_0197 [Ardenticatena maritima]|uniref:Uncharacterized protein n=2 Tax=Ardenticatena maritima TaxID=872965 RepID=A0A0M9UBE1_9CHLR|nr:hypothetical protein [Ardenticatena maritima]GAP61774.1 hypothetical protein ARMA_0197 [Ardenticatena maritima]
MSMQDPRETPGLSYEEMSTLIDEFLDTLAETLGDEEVDVETILRFVASLIHENNVRLAEYLRR